MRYLVSMLLFSPRCVQSFMTYIAQCDNMLHRNTLKCPKPPFHCNGIIITDKLRNIRWLSQTCRNHGKNPLFLNFSDKFGRLSIIYTIPLSFEPSRFVPACNSPASNTTVNRRLSQSRRLSMDLESWSLLAKKIKGCKYTLPLNSDSSG